MKAISTASIYRSSELNTIVHAQWNSSDLIPTPKTGNIGGNDFHHSHIQLSYLAYAQGR
jgi:hypothetical protein